MEMEDIVKAGVFTIFGVGAIVVLLGIVGAIVRVFCWAFLIH